MWPEQPGILRAPLRHEARHDVEARADLLGRGLEQDRAVGLLERVGEEDRRLVDAGPGLGVQALDRDAERAQLVEERREERLRGVGAQQRVAEHAGRDRLRADAFLVRPRLRRLREVEPLELHAAHRHEAGLLRAVQHALQHLPRAQRKRDFLAVLLPDELAQEERHAVVPGHRAVGPEVDARERVGEAPVPARDLRVVVADVLRVPAEHDVAEAEAALDRRHELVLVDVLAAQDAVDVRHGDLDAGARRLAHRLDHLRGAD